MFWMPCPANKFLWWLLPRRNRILPQPMTGKCRSLPRTRQGENMPISLKTQAERTAKTPIPARRAHVGGLHGFHSPAERVPTGTPKTGRCADVQECYENVKHRRKTPTGEFRQRKKPQRQQDKAAGSCAPPQRSHLPAVRAVSGIEMALFCGCQKWNDAVISQKPRNASKIKDNFDAITISGGFEP